MRNSGFIGQNQNIDIDKAMALVLVIGGDPAACREVCADMRGGEVLDTARHMNPGPERDIAIDDEIAGPQDRRRMDQPLLGVERQVLAQIGAVLGG